MLSKVKAGLLWVWTRWKKVGHAITRTLNFVLLILTYFLAIGPTALMLRVMGKDILDKKWDPNSDRESYWLERDPIPTDPSDYTRLF